VSEDHVGPGLIDRVRGAAGRRLMHLPAGVQRLLSRRRAVVVDGQTLDPMIQLLLSLRPKKAALIARPVRESRARMRREVLALRKAPTAVGAVQDLTIEGAAGPLQARSYSPPASPALPALLCFLHGGGFVLGDLDTHDEPCRMLCRHAGQVVLSVAYRRAPEHPFPGPLDDAVAAFRWAAAHAGALGADPDRVAIGGDSAGAVLAAVACQLLATETPRPVGQLLIYPSCDETSHRPSHDLFGSGFLLTAEDRSAFRECYIGGTGTDPADPRISPLLAPDLRGLPPALTVVAGFDVLRDEGEAYADALRAAGNASLVHREPSLPHGFVNLTPVSRRSRDALVEIARAWAQLISPRGRTDVAISRR